MGFLRVENEVADWRVGDLLFFLLPGRRNSTRFRRIIPLGNPLQLPENVNRKSAG
jgi:hypothetical protein